MRDCYRIANQIILIDSLFADVHQLCRDYRVGNSEDRHFDISICVYPEDVNYERKRSAENDRKEGRSIRDYSNAYLEELAAYRKIAEVMPSFDTVLVHGSCIAVDGIGYLFTAKSGTGKSTHTRLWKELFKERVLFVNDDKPLMRVGESEVTIFGTPWDGKHRLSNNTAVPLKAICFLDRGNDNCIYPIDREAAYPELLQQVYRPSETYALKKTLSILDRLVKQVPFYKMKCNQELDAAEMAYNMMKGQDI